MELSIEPQMGQQVAAIGLEPTVEVVEAKPGNLPGQPVVDSRHEDLHPCVTPSPSPPTGEIAAGVDGLDSGGRLSSSLQTGMTTDASDPR